jgi:transcriptional regulator with XRE-family HTH domain
VDSRQQLREFLASRRARITPEQAGLPAYGHHRRVPGLRREEVASLAGVSIEYYTRLERGNASGASNSVLEAVAAVLQLDDAERAHLFDQARDRPAGPSGHFGDRADRLTISVARATWPSSTPAGLWPELRTQLADVLTPRRRSRAAWWVMWRLPSVDARLRFACGSLVPACL